MRKEKYKICADITKDADADAVAELPAGSKTRQRACASAQRRAGRSVQLSAQVKEGLRATAAKQGKTVVAVRERAFSAASTDCSAERTEVTLIIIIIIAVAAVTGVKTVAAVTETEDGNDQTSYSLSEHADDGII